MRRSRRPIALLAIAVVLTVAAGAAIATTSLRANIRPAWDADEVLTVLAVGSDIGPPDRRGDPLRGRADALHLIAVDTARHRATIVDIPRDAWVGGDKVNAHLAYGGPERLRDVMERYTGVPIDFYAVTSFEGLRDMVDRLDGLVVEIDQPLRDRFSQSDLDAGRQAVDGAQALAFARNRKSLPDGDFGRTRHQGELLRFAHAYVRQERADLPTLTRLAGAFSRNTESDIPPSQLLRLAALALAVDPEHVRQVPLAGSFGMRNGQSVVHLRPGRTFSDIAAGKIGR